MLLCCTPPALQAALADAKIPKVEVLQGEDPTGAHDDANTQLSCVLLRSAACGRKRLHCHGASTVLCLLCLLCRRPDYEVYDNPQLFLLLPEKLFTAHARELPCAVQTSRTTKWMTTRSSLPSHLCWSKPSPFHNLLKCADEPDYEVDDDPQQAQRLDVSRVPLCVTVSQVRRPAGLGLRSVLRQAGG